MKNLNDNSCVGVFTSPVNKTSKLMKGDEKQFFGKWFVWSGSAWCLDEITHNVISEKNKGLKGYPIHSYSM